MRVILCYMEVTLNLPDKVFLDVSKFAKKTRRCFDEIVSERLKIFSTDELESPLEKSSDA